MTVYNAPSRCHGVAWARPEKSELHYYGYQSSQFIQRGDEQSKVEGVKDAFWILSDINSWGLNRHDDRPHDERDRTVTSLRDGSKSCASDDRDAAQTKPPALRTGYIPGFSSN
jgi:hypothetical protein